jgi:hypothetical protein
VALSTPIPQIELALDGMAELEGLKAPPKGASKPDPAKTADALTGFLSGCVTADNRAHKGSRRR